MVTVAQPVEQVLMAAQVLVGTVATQELVHQPMHLQPQVPAATVNLLQFNHSSNVVNK